MSHRAPLTVAVCVLALIVPTMSPAASAEEHGDGSIIATAGEPHTYDETAEQQSLEELRTYSSSSEGMTSLVPTDGGRAVELRWVEPIPERIARLDGQQWGPLVVRVLPAKFSQEDIHARSDRVLEASRAKDLPPVAYITSTPDGETLRVAFAESDFAKVSEESIARMEELSGMGVRVEIGDAPAPTSRLDDDSPWRGGAVIQQPTWPSSGTFCSSAFAVQTAGGGDRLLSARHCDPTGDLAWTDGQWQSLSSGGAAVDIKPVDDTMLINTVGNTQGKVYGAGINATSADTGYSRNVASAGSATAGGEVCTSGANSGQHCNLNIYDAMEFSWTCGSNTCHGWRAANANLTVAVVGGDSGGPVFRILSDGRVAARGVIWGGSNDVACGTVRRAVSNCYAYVWFNDIVRVLNAWSVTIKTLP